MGKILYGASTYGHIKNFHIPYIKRLAEQGHEVHIVANMTGVVSAHGASGDITEKKELPTELKELGVNLNIRVIHIPFEKKMASITNMKCTKQLKVLIKRENYDVVNVHTSLASFFVRLAVMWAKPQNCTVINTVHGYLFDEKTTGIKRNILLGAEKITKPATDILVVMNKQDYEMAEKYKLYKDRLIKIDGVGIDAQRFSRGRVEEQLLKDMENLENHREKMRKKIGIQAHEIVMIYAAEFSKRKNQKMLIEAMETLPRNTKLLLAGKGDTLEECKAFANGRGLIEAKRVEFLGQVSNLEYYYYLSDICVSASRSEGLPFNIMEAMAMGLPVVATRVKGHEDLVETGQNGYLYEFDHVEGFVDGVMSLSSQNGQAQRLNIAKRNVEKAKAYSLDNVCDVVMGIISNIV